MDGMSVLDGVKNWRQYVGPALKSLVKKAKIALVVAVVAMFVIAIAVQLIPETVALANGGNKNDKITTCHATGSKSNPYVKIEANKNGDVDGHDGHSGDIIPPFDYNDHGVVKHYGGKNWNTEGKAIYNNSCKLPVKSSPTPVVNTP